MGGGRQVENEIEIAEGGLHSAVNEIACNARQGNYRTSYVPLTSARLRSNKKLHLRTKGSNLRWCGTLRHDTSAR